MMKVKTKAGIEIEIDISGTQEEPTITMKSQKIGDKVFGGEGHIAASQKRSRAGVPAIADSLFFSPAFFQVDLAPVRTAIAALPKKICMAQKVQETRNLDGDIFEVDVWKIEGTRTTKNGHYIQDSELGDFLDRRGITEIETEKAIEMWSLKYETPEKLARREEQNKKTSALMQQWADEEEMENGAPLHEEEDTTPYHPKEG